MGNYATVAQFRARTDTPATATQIAQLARTAVTLDQNTYLESLITRAEGLVNSFIAKDNTVPIVTDASDGLLQEMTLAIAEYELFKRGMASDVPEKYKYSYDKALELLMAIAKGELDPWAVVTDDGQTSLDIVTDTVIMGESELGDL